MTDVIDVVRHSHNWRDLSHLHSNCDCGLPVAVQQCVECGELRLLFGTRVAGAQNMERFCVHLKDRDPEARRVYTHVTVSLKANPSRSRSEMDDTTHLCAVCSGFLVANLQELEGFR